MLISCSYDSASGADPRGVIGVSRPPLQKYIKEAKRMMYWYKNTKMQYLLKSTLFVIKQPIIMFQGVAPTTPPTPYLVK